MNRFMFSQKRSSVLVSSMLIFAGVVGLGFAGCNSGSTESDNPPFSGGFVASDDTVGSLSLTLNASTLSVSETTGFHVSVVNQNGAPVPNISVFCDSESGIGIIEPTSGQEITNASGQMSGRIGCAAPGSFQFGCRLPVGTNMREFVQVVCEGPVPAGFDGFENAGGGGLGNGSGGGGVDSPEDGNPGGAGTDGIRLIQIEVIDSGQDSTLNVDTTQVNCEPDPNEDPIPEPFFDSLIKFYIVNNSNQAIQITGYTYTVPNATGEGTPSHTSSIIAPSPIDGGNDVAPFGGELITTALFTDVVGGEKAFIGSSTNIPASLGVRNISVAVSGRNENGDTFMLTGAIGLNFDNYNRCP
ncbi:MAG: hypothetical protein ACO3XO_05465 [Bdellovibrionota bacterium]